jgi:hypothetical protein
MISSIFRILHFCCTDIRPIRDQGLSILTYYYEYYCPEQGSSVGHLRERPNGRVRPSTS